MELKALARDRGLRNYSQMRKAELVALLWNNPPTAPQMSTREPIDDRRLRQPPRSMKQSATVRQGFASTSMPSPQEMDIFEQQEMSKRRPQVKIKLNKWFDWLINHVPKPIKDGASKAFKTFKDKIMRLYNRVTGFSGNQTQWSTGPASGEPEPFKPIESEKAFNDAYGNYRVNVRPKIDVDTFFNRIRKGLIEFIK